MDAFLGTILAWPASFAPAGWAFCYGQTMNIQTNAALYAIIGTTYGGDGVSNFKLPDLRGRTLIGANAVAPMTPRLPGAFGGQETNAITGATASGALALTIANLPAHTHTVTATLDNPTATTTVKVSTGTQGVVGATEGCTLSSTAGGSAPAAAIYQKSEVSPAPATVSLGNVTTTVAGTIGVTVGSTGNGQPIALTLPVVGQTTAMQPFMAMNYIICLSGLFPSRN